VLSRRLVRVLGFASAIILFIFVILIYLCEDIIIGLFTHDEEVISMLDSVFDVTLLFLTIDGFQGYLQGPIRGLGL